VEIVQVLLNAPQATSEWINTWRKGETALSVAVVNRHTSVAQALIDAGADVNMPTGAMRTRVPLHDVEDIDTARVLLTAGARDSLTIEVLDGCRYTYTAFSRACDLPELDIAMLFLEYPSAIVPDRKKFSYLHVALRNAIERNDGHLLHILLNSNIPLRLNSRTGAQGTTLLIFAAKWGKITSLSALLEHGADPRVTDNEGNTPLMMTFTPEYVEVLVDAAPDTVNMQNHEGMTALMCYASKEERFIDGPVPQLFRSAYDNDVHVDVDAECNSGYTALQYALENGNLNVVHFLLRMGANVLDFGGTILMTPYQHLEPYECSWRDRDTNNCIIVIISHILSLDLDQSEDSDDVSDEGAEEPAAKRRRI
jgi:ankyrin repeat protein